MLVLHSSLGKERESFFECGAQRENQTRFAPRIIWVPLVLSRAKRFASGTDGVVNPVFHDLV